MGKGSVVCGGIGLLLLALAIVAQSGTVGMFALAMAVIGLIMGLMSRETKAGKAGLVVNLVAALCSIGIFTLFMPRLHNGPVIADPAQAAQHAQ